MNSDVVAIERLTRADLAAGLALSDAAGWNQVEEDWALFVECGLAFGCRGPDGALIATAAALPYGGGVGWVSMVLVDARFRHRGLATALLGACVDALQAAGRIPVLDATEVGVEVYRHSGFVAGFGFERWEGDGGGGGAEASAAFDEPRIAEIAAADAAAGGANRAALVRDLLQRPSTRCWRGPDGSFAIVRAGRRAAQVGPVVAASESVAGDLLDTAIDACAGPVFVDVPTRWTGLSARLGKRGFARQRSFLRMALGDTVALHADTQTFALAGPEFG